MTQAHKTYYYYYYYVGK